VKHVLPWLAFWLTLFWLWQLLVGEWNHQEWIAGASAATVAATVGEVARTLGGVRARVPLRWLPRAWTVPGMVLVDFGIVTWALLTSLVRREIVRGSFRAHEFPVRGDDAVATGIRAWAGLAADYSPNAYVIDLDPERGVALFHDLIPFRKSEEPA
jgi:hypothetical protein